MSKIAPIREALKEIREYRKTEGKAPVLQSTDTDVQTKARNMYFFRAVREMLLTYQDLLRPNPEDKEQEQRIKALGKKKPYVVPKDAKYLATQANGLSKINAELRGFYETWKTTGSHPPKKDLAELLSLFELLQKNTDILHPKDDKAGEATA